MSKQTETVTKEGEFIPIEQLTKEESIINRIHIALCIVLAFSMSLLNVYVRPIKLTGIFDQVNLLTFVPLIVTIFVFIFIRTTLDKKIKNITLPNMTAQQLSAHKSRDLTAWMLLTIAVIVGMLFYFFLGAGPAAILVALLTLVYLYSQKAEYDGIRSWLFAGTSGM